MLGDPLRLLVGHASSSWCAERTGENVKSVMRHFVGCFLTWSPVSWTLTTWPDVVGTAVES